MKKHKAKIIALGTAMVALSCLPAQAATDNLNIEANIVASPLALTATQNLNFGAFTNGGAGGTVTVNTAGVGNYVGITQVLGPATQEGRVLMTGNSGVDIDVVVLGGGAIPVTHSTNAQTMQVSNFDINGLGRTVTVNMAGTNTSLPVGAELTVPAGRLPGNYTGTFTVEAIYR